MNEFVKFISESFLGKVVTVVTNSSSLPVKDGVSHSQYFTGEMIRVDSFGILLKHLQIGTISWFSFPLQGIIEEQYISNDDPRHKTVQEELKKKEESNKKATVKPVANNSQFISVDELKSTLNKIKKS